MASKRLYFLVLFFSFALFTLFSMNTYAQNPEDMTPTPPPKVPAADFSEDGANYLDVMYMRYSGEDFELNGFGLGYNYVGAFGNTGFNIGFGFQYLTGENDDKTFDITMFAIPINANLAFRIAGTADSSNLIIFGGIHYNYSHTNVDIEPDNNVEINMWVYGPLVGAKANLRLSPMVNFIPYYALKRDIIDADVYYNGELISGVDIPDVTSHLFGFDIEIGAISVGTMLNMLNNADSDMITIYLTINLDYKESSTTGSE
jgi:hypothetical protein